MVLSLREALGPDFEVAYPEMPDGAAPEYGAWSAKISRELSALDGGVILVGHSLGASILLKHLSEEQVDEPIAGIFLLATPYWEATDWEVAEFALREDFPATLQEETPIFLYHSRDDEVVPFSHLGLYAGRLPRATVREFEGGGHQMGDDLSEVAADIGGLQGRLNMTFEDRSTEDHVYSATSGDGTRIAFERLGDGHPVILVAGASCDRAITSPLAEELAKHFTVINYDRRGRGDSGDTQPYAVEREIEDLETLIAEVGGAASVYGHSSGAALAVHAAAHGLPITRLVLHEPPYAPDTEEWRRSSREYGETLGIMLAEGRRGDAAALFMRTVGMPQEMVEGMRKEPWWTGMEKVAPTLAYDSEIMGDISREGTIPTGLLGSVAIPTLVLCGGASPAWMIDIGRQVAKGLPEGRLDVLEGQEHAVSPEVLVPVLAEFFTTGSKQAEEGD